MLRDLVLASALLFCIALTLRYVFAGVLTWTWLAIMSPHVEVYGVITSSMRVNFTVAVITILAWFFSKKRQMPTVDGTLVTILLFLAWMTFNCIFAVDPGSSWPLWDNTWKILALGVLVGATATTKLRIHALIWIIVVSLLYYGIKGGIINILTGGGQKTVGPDGTLIGDNNQLALALLMILPLVNYLRLHSENRYVRMGLVGAGCLTFFSILSSNSRGAYLALSALALLGWVRARNKFTYPVVVAAIALPAIMLMPQAFYDRISTLNSVDQDESFQGRITAWKVAYYYARDHFPFGAGFAGPEKPWIFLSYFPGGHTHAAHSIFFQVLGEHGFPGLILFVIILLIALVNAQKIRKAARFRPELVWVRDLATMIQLGLLAYCVGGAALSMAYDDVAVIWFLLLPVLAKFAMQPKHQMQMREMGFQRMAPLHVSASNASNGM